MQRDLLKSRFAKLPSLPALDAQGHELSEDDDDVDQDEERDSFPAALPLPGSSRPRCVVPGSSSKDYSPLTAEGYFSSALEVDISSSSTSNSSPPSATFRVYYTPPISPSAHDDDDDDDSSGGTGGAVFVCVHGAGYSALSFACFAKDVTEKSEGKVGVLAYDARGHGKTKASAEDMSIDRLNEDLVGLLKTMFPKKREAPTFVLIGHSMGGAVVSTACNRIQAEVGSVVGVAVIDVVEGTAIDALSSMGSIIANQPKGFRSIESAIEWHVRTKTLNNLASARISVPPLVRRSSKSGDPDQEPYEWTADLAATEPFWRGWFTGLSSKFLGCRSAKLLLLAGAETLDKELMIGQMQGKYQLEVIAQSGHCVQEDHPLRTAELLLSFWERNDRTDVLKGVKKVGEK